MMFYLLTNELTKERLDSCLKNLDSFGIKPEIIKSDILICPKESCFSGHNLIISNFEKTKDDLCIVFEDDCILLQKPDYDLLKQVEFDIFLLGCVPLDVIQISDKYSRISKFFQTHCYCISKKGAEKFLQQTKNQTEIKHIDIFFSEIFSDIKCLNDLIAKQNYNFKSKIPKK